MELDYQDEPKQYKICLKCLRTMAYIIENGNVLWICPFCAKMKGYENDMEESNRNRKGS